MNIDTLNDRQKKAVTTINGPLLVLAGAGSGKTKVLTTRIAYLINENNVNPSNILAITFTNKAAKEMKDRVIRILGPKAYSIQISTFHSFGLLIMKENYDKLGYDSNFTILDSDDSLSIIKKIMKDLNIDIKEFNPKAIRNHISNAKNALIDAKSYEKFANGIFEQKVFEVYKIYERKLKTNNSLDFDDLLMLPIVLFKKRPDVLAEYQERFKYVLIDEYQDTNEAQYILTKMISAKYRNLCVVGDNDQSIYSFRGSNYQNILNFERDYKDAEVVLLEENYRSTQTILNAANNIIKNNKLRKEKNLWTSNEVGDKIIYHRASNEKDEANYIVSEVNKLIDNNVDKNEIVVLYRTNAQSRNIEEAFLKSNIPYKVVGSFYFYNRKEIKDLIAYLKVIYNTKDDVNLLRIINVPKRGIGLKTIENLMDKASLNNLSIFDSIDSGKELAFKELIASLIRKSEKCTLTELIDLILDASGMLKELESEKSLESEARIENLEEFKSITKSFEERDGIISLEAFLNEISLVSDIEEHKDQKDVVTLMTVHSAKGLEFDNVFIAGFEEGIFPHYNSFDSEDELEEERRLCYVAITRARKKLWIVNTLVRLLYGNSEAHVPSRFINEIGNEYLESDKIPDKKEIKLDRFKNSGIISEKVNHDDIKVGDKINHTEFGIGVVITVDKSILTVAFKHPIGIKKLMKGHKSITKV